MKILNNSRNVSPLASPRYGDDGENTHILYRIRRVMKFENEKMALASSMCKVNYYFFISLCRRARASKMV